MSDDVLLKTAEAAEALNISRDAVLQLCKAGFLKHTKLGPKTIRIFKSSVDAFIKKGLNGYGK
jgi:excisionase family DNA binding protein